MTINELDQRLMGEFTIESMMGEDAMTIPENVELYEDFNVRAMQEQAPLWCLVDLLIPKFVEEKHKRGVSSLALDLSYAIEQGEGEPLMLGLLSNQQLF